MAHGVLSATACRRFCCVGTPLFALFFFISYRNTMNEELEAFNLRLQASVSNAESLAAQLKVINEHKYTIERQLSDKKLSTEQLEQELISMKSENEKISRRLNEAKVWMVLFPVHLWTEKMKLEKCGGATKASHTESVLPVTIQNSVNSTLNNLSSGAAVNHASALPTSAASTDTVSIAATVTNGTDRLTPNTKPLNVDPIKESHHDSYVAGNSVHFHRHESVGKNVEFRRQEPGSNDHHVGELPAKNEKMKQEVTDTAKKSPLLQILGRRVENRPNKKKSRRKDARENDDIEENVIDFRHDEYPDQKNAADYKEMPVR